jgi:hypothetical protein
MRAVAVGTLSLIAAKVSRKSLDPESPQASGFLLPGLSVGRSMPAPGGITATGPDPTEALDTPHPAHAGYPAGRLGVLGTPPGAGFGGELS